jgi:hypothetical protein
MLAMGRAICARLLEEDISMCANWGTKYSRTWQSALEHRRVLPIRKSDTKMLWGDSCYAERHYQIVAFLLWPQASHLNGAALNVNGGPSQAGQPVYLS